MTTATPIAASQRALRLDVAADTRLVTVETAKAVLGVDWLSIEAMIDEGSVMAFDISPRTGLSRIREVRIWVGTMPGCEVPLPRDPAAAIAAAIDQVVGPGTEMSSAQLQARFSADDNTIHRLVDAGQLVGAQRRDGRARRLWITAPSIKAFLGNRLLGAGQ